MKNRYRLYLGAAAIFALSQVSAQTDFFLKSTGAVDNPGSWADGSNNDAQSSDFTAGNIWHMDGSTRSGASLSTNWSLGANETLIIESGFDFTVTTGGSMPAYPAIEIPAGGTITINEAGNFNFTSLDPASMLHVTSSSYSIEAEFTGGGNIDYGNVWISQSTGITGPAAGADTYIHGVLTIDAGKTLSLGGFILDMLGTSGSFAGLGDIFADNVSIIVLTGGNGGNNGSLRLAPGGNHLLTLWITYGSASDLITLENDVFIETGGFYQHDFGTLDLNGFSLFVSPLADVKFPSSATDGVLIGDPASSLTFNGTIGKFNSSTTTLFMDAANRSLKSLNLNSSLSTLVMGTNLEIVDSLSLIDGTLDMNGNTLIVKASGSSKGRIAQMGPNALFTGSVTVETFLSGGTTGWMNLGSPGISGAGVTLSQWDSWATSGGTVGIPMTCTGCFYAPWNGTFTSVQDWTESTSNYSDLSSSSPLVHGKGYWVYVGDGQNTTNDLLLTTSGSYTQDANNPPSIPLTAGGSGTNTGWNLVSNPYASPISWTRLYGFNNNSNIDGQIHAWSPDNLDYGDFSQGTIGGTGTNGFGDIIPAGP